MFISSDIPVYMAGILLIRVKYKTNNQSIYGNQSKCSNQSGPSKCQHQYQYVEVIIILNS